MNPTHTALALVLDRSGSMQSCLEPAIAATNNFLRQQREPDTTGIATSADVTICLFDDRLEHPFVGTDILDVPEFTPATYQPRGSTALLDAIGSTIDELGTRLADLPEARRPGTVIVAIVTDGMENASTRYDWKQINRMIRHQEDTYAWQFLFLAAGKDAVAQAAQMGLNAANTAAFVNDATGYGAASGAMIQKCAALRASKYRDLDDKETTFFESKVTDLVRNLDPRMESDDDSL